MAETEAVAEISIVDHELPYDSHNLYDVHFYGDLINTLVTHDPTQVATWITETLRDYKDRLQSLIVGFDVEWRPNFNKNQENPVAVLQLCVDRRCLVFQILRCVKHEQFELPDALRDFLGDSRVTFVGVGIKSDAEKLVEDYGLSVRGKKVDLRKLAAEKHEDKKLKNGGMKELAGLVLEKEMEKPRSVTMGKWDNPWLVPKQVQYACLDAYVAFKIARKLIASDC